MPPPEADRDSWVQRHAAPLALGWGFAEATLLFIVPDVLITWLALRSGRSAWRACLWALLGALVGGSAMWLWGRHDAAAALRVLDAIPAISEDVCDVVAQHIRDEGAIALLRGPIGGLPYKVYAVQAGAAGIPPSSFVAISVPARLARFVLIAALTVLACRLLNRTPVRTRQVVHLLLWAVFYAWYFWHFSDPA